MILQDFFFKSHILLVDDIQDTLDKQILLYPKHSTRVIKNEEKDEFQIAQAQTAIKEAYIATSEVKYIFLCGATFRVEAQNALLKILEEPPLNIVFIILTNLKNTLLPTIYSRLPYKNLKIFEIKNESNLNIKKLDLKDIYNFLKDNQKLSKNDAKIIVEEILIKIKNEKIELKEKELEVFSKSIKLLDLNSKPVNVLTLLLLTLFNKKI
ncbi:DNA polymerase III subunit delta' [Aliarcobacter cibarius]|uniref:DNA polymerase III subunit delta n=1 Tax=Aliarcobacter cibarius TaxID=255507 RepID=A0A5J6RGG5_9BACT|nr:DNA polymerase III subunit delta' [Aliarcobacter cibarius]QEZ89176.1 DNA polymerase III, delta prime subunit [Aliarcobacter cibarius]QKJ27211.1 DNA polymerase III, delta prime subunit [Aliarcobacter cibarius]TLT01569.1 DNA polymerase III subunit delta' [Aliarcobacter cibarius]TLT02060.1 DNA polymerase III subunit delta' [Aliarcobacter cibarius]TLT04098.1 DNA polymerase III subunit delta' [Aliarcobacter cibarius]